MKCPAAVLLLFYIVVKDWKGCVGGGLFAVKWMGLFCSCDLFVKLVYGLGEIFELSGQALWFAVVGSVRG